MKLTLNSQIADGTFLASEVLPRMPCSLPVLYRGGSSEAIRHRRAVCGCARWVIPTNILVIRWPAPSIVGVVVTRPVCENDPITDTVPTIQPWLWSQNISIDSQASTQGLEGTTVEQVPLPHRCALEVIIQLHNWVGKRGRCSVAAAAAIARKIVQCLPDESYPFLRRCIILCSENVSRTERYNFLKPEMPKETTSLHRVLWSSPPLSYSSTRKMHKVEARTPGHICLRQVRCGANHQGSDYSVGISHLHSMLLQRS